MDIKHDHVTIKSIPLNNPNNIAEVNEEEASRFTLGFYFFFLFFCVCSSE